MLELPDDWEDQPALCDFGRVAEDLRFASNLQVLGPSPFGDESDAAVAIDAKLVDGFVANPCYLTALSPIALRPGLWKYFERHISADRR